MILLGVIKLILERIHTFFTFSVEIRAAIHPTFDKQQSINY
jgi:hypothetical protein